MHHWHKTRVKLCETQNSMLNINIKYSWIASKMEWKNVSETIWFKIYRNYFWTCLYNTLMMLVILHWAFMVKSMWKLESYTKLDYKFTMSLNSCTKINTELIMDIDQFGEII